MPDELPIEEIKERLRAAYNFANFGSSDPHTKVGAVIYHATTNASVCGANCLPRNIAEKKGRLERPAKSTWLLHAEECAILRAAAFGLVTDGATMVCPWAACTRCSRQIIEVGITTLVRHAEMHDRTPERWRDEIAQGEQMMIEAGVKIVTFRGRVGGVKALFDGVVWYP